MEAKTGLELGTLRLYEPGDEVEIIEMFEEVFGVPTDHERWRWRHQDAPTGAARVVVVEVDDKIVGHLAYLEFQVFVEGRRRLQRTGSDFMIRPAYRGRRLSEHFANVNENARRPDIGVSFPSDVLIDIMKAHPDDVVLILAGRLPQWVRWNTPAAVGRSRGMALPAPARPLIGAVLAANRVITRLASPRLALDRVDEPGADFDALAEESSAWAPAIRVRDAAYVRWRWIKNPGGRWQVWAARRGGKLVGWITFGVNPADPAATGRITDMLAPDPSTARGLMTFAADRLAAEGSDTVLFDYLDPRPWSRRACYLAGFLPRGKGPQIVLYPEDLAADLVELGSKIESWYLTLGDTDLA